MCFRTIVALNDAVNSTLSLPLYYFYYYQRASRKAIAIYYDTEKVSSFRPAAAREISNKTLLLKLQKEIASDYYTS